MEAIIFNLLQSVAATGGPLVTIIGIQLWCVLELKNLKKIVTNGLSSQVKITSEKVSKIEGFLEAKEKQNED